MLQKSATVVWQQGQKNGLERPNQIFVLKLPGYSGRCRNKYQIFQIYR